MANKKGYTTTEFYIAIITTIFGMLLTTGKINMDSINILVNNTNILIDNINIIVGPITTILPVVSYIIGRTVIKSR